jgi:predicted phosphodiesterase
MKILLIGDIHGRIFLLLKIVQKITSQTKIDFIVQVGDFGYFTDPDQLDESTIRFSRDDPSELHTIDYFKMDHTLLHSVKKRDLMVRLSTSSEEIMRTINCLKDIIRFLNLNQIP